VFRDKEDHMNTLSVNSELLPTRFLLQRYSVSDRTIDRWCNNSELGFPQPMVVNKRRYWRLSELEEWERSRALANGRAA
jgi:predicted DNA-binding transcriptional regulator AlpA